MIVLNAEATSTVGCNISSGIIAEKLNELEIRNKTILINSKTLYRNFIQCIDGSSVYKIKLLKNKISLRKIYDMFIEDTMKFVEGLFALRLDVKIYIPTYEVLGKQWDNFKANDDFKGLKYFILDTEKNACDLLLEKMSGIVKRTDHKIKYEKDLYVVTHIGLDLLSISKSDVNIIESNTGEIKDSSKWFSKYKKIGTKDMSIFPFNSLFYFILGDNVFVKSQNIKFRTHIYKLLLETRFGKFISIKEMMDILIRKDPILKMDFFNIKDKINI